MSIFPSPRRRAEILQNHENINVRNIEQGEIQHEKYKRQTSLLADWLTGWLTRWLKDRLADLMNDWLNSLLTGWLNYSHTHSLTSLLTGWLTYIPTYLLAYSLTHSLTHSLADWLAEWTTYWMPDWLAYWLVNLLTYLLIHSFTDWLTDWFPTSLKWLGFGHHALQPWRWRQPGTPKRFYPPTTLPGTTSQKATYCIRFHSQLEHRLSSVPCGEYLNITLK
jgi:hypothetical protein